MERDDYRIGGERFDISETATAVSFANGEGQDQGKFVLKIETEDGKEASIVMNYFQMTALRRFVVRAEDKAKTLEVKKQKYDSESPSLFSIECELEVSLSDGTAKTLAELIRDVAFGLALPTDYCDEFRDYRHFFSEDVQRALKEMAKDGRVEQFGAGAYRLTSAVLSSIRAKDIRLNEQKNEAI